MLSPTRPIGADIVAMFLSLSAVLVSYLVAERIYEGLPHIEDEMAYSWQAQVYASGQLTIPSPKYPSNFMIPSVVDYQGQRFAKYPPGWPMMLAFGLRLGIRNWVNPLLAGLAVWLTYRLGQKLFGRSQGMLAAFLTTVSPFFLMNTASLMSHTWALVLTLAFAISWLDTFSAPPLGTQREKNNQFVNWTQHAADVPPKWMTGIVAGLSLGNLVLVRPLTALGVAIVFFIHGLILLCSSDQVVRVRVLSVYLLAMAVGTLLMVWQFAITGNLWLNPYILWVKYDSVGFGPGHGPVPGGHTLRYALLYLKPRLYKTLLDVFGWGDISWLFLPVGLWAMRKNYHAWLIAALPLGLVIVYLAYWVSYGTRYYFEGLPGFTLTTAVGILSLIDWIHRKKHIWHFMRSLLTSIFVLALFAQNLLSFLPHRLNSMYHLYNIGLSRLEPFQTEQAQALTPALVLVHVESSWTDYGSLLDLENPWLNSPFIFAISGNRLVNEELVAFYHDRNIIDFYPNRPLHFDMRRAAKK